MLQSNFSFISHFNIDGKESYFPIPYETLKRKYGGSIESLLNRLVEIKSSLSDLSSDGEKINILKTEIEELKKSYRKDSIQLHSARKDSAKKLESLIEIEMKKLNIPKPRFRIQFDIKEDNDSYIVNGQKIWTSRAEHSDLMLLLARTTPRDEVQKRTEGLSVFIVDMRKALGNGLEIKPIRTMINHATTEVFFDNLQIEDQFLF